MPTSELSDALNPYYAQPRSRLPQPPAPQQHPVIHRSELDLAISVPPRPPIPSAHHSSHLPARPHGGGIHAVQELVRFLTSTREAQEIEHKRRIAWEQEQEAKYKLRQAEMERRMLEMQQEITALKARLAFSSPASSSAHTKNNPAPSQQQTASSQQPTPSTSPTLSHTSAPSPPVCQPVAGPSMELITPTRFVNVDSSHRDASSRSATGFETEDEPNTDNESPPQHRMRRRNHHDTRCLTIQHAMRNHLLRAMMLETDKDLPDSHIEGTPLGADDPVRFVWDKTPKQSVHNARMKERVIKDLKANRKLYRYVTDKDFGKKTLDSVFDQAFVTLRQKFKAQRDDTAAGAHKQREDLKAQRARRLSRRKVKLGNRSDARNKMAAFEHVTFDGALQMECMSSEESDVDEDAVTGTRTTFFRIRGFAWRSIRLQQFYDVLDREDKMDNTQRPRRGVGRKERIPGPPKEGMLVPPRGVASWMISKQWMRIVQTSHRDVLGLLREIVDDPAGFDWGEFHELGEESS